jgi:hypothetical protein
MNSHNPNTEDTFLHVVSVALTSLDFEPSETDEEPILEDMGTGLTWGRDTALTLAYTNRRECWVVVPDTLEVVFKAYPEDIVLH